MACRQLFPNARDHHRVVDGLGDVVVLRRLVGHAEGQRQVERLRRCPFPVIDADMRLDAHLFNKYEIHIAALFTIRGILWKPSPFT